MQDKSKKVTLTRLLLACVLLSSALVMLARTPVQARSAACVLNNGDFEGADALPWYVQGRPSTGATASLSRAAGYNSTYSARVDITSAGVYPWDIQLVHENTPLTAGRRYALSFWARSSDPKTSDILIQQFENPLTVIWTRAFVTGSTWQRFEFVVDIPLDSPAPTPAFRINLGGDRASLWIDDIVLCESGDQPAPLPPQPVGPSCRLQNGDFDSGSFASWQFDVSGGAQALLQSAPAARGQNAARIDITQPGSKRDQIRLRQGTFAVQADGTLALAFFARSTQGQSMLVRLVDATGGELWQQSLRLPDPANDAAYKHYYFVLPTFRDATATLQFEMGVNTGEIWIDSVSLCDAPVRFSDDFNGDALGDKWQHCVAYGRDCALDDANGNVEWMNPANATLANGILSMNFTAQQNSVCIGCNYGPGRYITRNYAGVLIQTSQSFVTRYGYFETRMKMPRSSGLWPAFWLLPALSPEGNVIWPPEIDVVEYFSREPLVSIHTVHFKTPTKFNEEDGRRYQHPAELSDDFHTFAVNWTPDVIIWYVDGMETHRSTISGVALPMYMLLSTGSGGPAGSPDADLSQATTEVDYVRVFDNSESFALSGPQQPFPTPLPVASSTPGPAPTSGPSPTPRPTWTPNPRLKQRLYMPMLRKR
jgi:beta-glucanase (GH16 family)